jgi:hypothetical protein
MKFEVYRQLFRITEWRDGCVFRTEPVRYDWFPEAVVDANVPRTTNLIYAAPDDEFARNNMTIRRAR